MITHYPSMTNVLRRYAHLGGNQGGIMPGFLVSVADVPGEPQMRAMTATMPQYHRLIMDDPLMEVQYHLSGYGLYNEEALVKLMGESVERYAAMAAITMFDFRYASYKEMATEGPTMPLEYLGILDASQQAVLASKLHRYTDRPPTEDDLIAWVKCPSLTRPGEDVWVPAQLFFLGFTSSPAGDLLFTPSFSTGTAAHVSLENALRNALIEAVQIDAFILNWYTPTPAPAVVVDDDATHRLLGKLKLGPTSDYEVRPIYLTRPELPLPTIGVYMDRRSDTLPLLTFGVQGDGDPRYAMIRGTMESAAILGLSMYSAVFDPVKVHASANTSPYLDLDTNVLYYATPTDAALKRRIVAERFAGSVKLSEIPGLDNPLDDLIAMVAGVSEWATYLDITPPELDGTPWKVVRVLIPELLSMCLPGMPPKAHPRMRSYGGVAHDHPHPLP
ncbi:streptolysin associated protein SagD [Longispora fulva]|uniref:Thiazole/oxazole-forming peptide maturase SagD family component n=1 Tax=Longispora fulva TaxID=619741 RepID=A0A8J7GQY1_9ACTN|nr:YcaO-like family protein [Longispora fulva]MBG6135316.1 thiazole/oxazole-forming peptide maturase SagD family component [Longispora fulva]GIG56445.1 streptolysin associated protein SagD [Longispora fulva]